MEFKKPSRRTVVVGAGVAALAAVGQTLGGDILRLVNLDPDRDGAYKGIWYRNDPSYEYYAGAQATFPSNIRPIAIYSQEADKTYFTWGDDASNVCVGAYDHVTKTLSAPVVLGSYTLGDAHKNGSLLIDHDGYIYCFFGGHNETMRVRRSTGPLDISAWESAVTLPGTTKLTYSQPWELEAGKIVLLTRTTAVGQVFLVSTDRAATWSEATTIVANTGTFGAYFISIAEQGEFPRKVHVIWDVFETALYRRDFYYACSADGGETWQDSEGNTLTLPIGLEGGELLLDSGEDQVNTCDLQLDSEGLVRALVLQGLGTSFVWKLIRQNGPGDWDTFTLPPAADHHFDIGALVLVGDDDWRAYLPSNPNLVNQDGGEIEEWQSLDRGETWAKIRVLTDGSTFVHNNVKSVVGGQSDFRVLWSYGDPDVEGSGTPKTTEVSLFMAGDDYVRQMASDA